MSFDNLSKDNILLYAMKAYDKPNCIMGEFNEDMKRFNYLKRLFKRYRKLGEIKQQLVLNHLIVIYNVFGTEVATRLLFYKISKEDYSALKTYLLLINCMPDRIKGVKGQDILSSSISIEIKIAQELRRIGT
jgi:hypothetical protein|tara:strand:- start:356 stop:751 length:396 start_codon:yes stop_codon:yes gene_type:complete